MAEAYGIDIAGGFLRTYTNEADAHQIVSQLEQGRVVPLCRETVLTENAIPMHQVLTDLVAMASDPETESDRLNAALRNAQELLDSVAAKNNWTPPVKVSTEKPVAGSAS